MNYIAFDSHKRYTLASVEKTEGGVMDERRIDHRPGAIEQYLSQWEKGTPVAVETLGNWYWIADEIEKAGMVPQLVHAGKAKLMMGQTNKTDKLDARGLNRLQRTGTLPTVWIPPAELRDQRELIRTRMVLAEQRTRLKNRILATLAKYGWNLDGVTDAFGARGRALLQERIGQLPEHTAYSLGLLLRELDLVREQIADSEKRIRAVYEQTEDLHRLLSLPGVGWILGTVVLTEVGDVRRFPSAAHLASYAGTTPRVHASGGRTRTGQLRSDVNHYLKWAYIEAANVVAINRRRRGWMNRHVARLYARVAAKKGHQTAVGAVARHLAEATYWILAKKEFYREPQSSPVLSTGR